MITHEFNLDMYPGGYKPTVHLSQYDDDFQLKITPFSSEGSWSIATGTTVAIRGTKPDGNGFSADTTLSNGVVTVTGDKQMTAAAGKAVFELTFSSSAGKELNSVNFPVLIERAALDKDTVISKSQTRELVEIEDNADELIAAAGEAKTAKEGAAAAQTAAEESAAAAKASAEAAKTSETSAAASAEDASAGKTAAETAVGKAAASQEAAASSEESAAAKADEAESSAACAKSWAVGTSATETSGTDETCARHYAEQAKTSADSASAAQTAAEESAAAAKASAEAAKTSETNAAASAEDAEKSAESVKESAAAVSAAASEAMSSVIGQETKSLNSVNDAGAAAVKRIKETADGISKYVTDTLDSGLTLYLGSQSKIQCVLLRGTLKNAVAANGTVASLSAEAWDGYHEYTDSNGHRFALNGTDIKALSAIPAGAYINLSFTFMTK